LGTRTPGRPGRRARSSSKETSSPAGRQRRFGGRPPGGSLSAGISAPLRGEAAAAAAGRGGEWEGSRRPDQTRTDAVVASAGIRRYAYAIYWQAPHPLSRDAARRGPLLQGSTGRDRGFAGRLYPRECLHRDGDGDGGRPASVHAIRETIDDFIVLMPCNIDTTIPGSTMQQRHLLSLKLLN
jgi:hypothetical protein